MIFSFSSTEGKTVSRFSLSVGGHGPEGFSSSDSEKPAYYQRGMIQVKRPQFSPLRKAVLRFDPWLRSVSGALGHSKTGPVASRRFFL